MPGIPIVKCGHENPKKITFIEEICDKHEPGYHRTVLLQILRPNWSSQFPCPLEAPVENTFGKF